MPASIRVSGMGPGGKTEDDEMELLDDGTMDTLFRCRRCGAVERWSEVERGQDGAPSDEAFEQAREGHDCKLSRRGWR